MTIIRPRQAITSQCSPHERGPITPLVRRVWTLFCGGIDTNEICEKVSRELHRDVTEAEVYHALSRAKIAKFNGEFTWPYNGPKRKAAGITTTGASNEPVHTQTEGEASGAITD